MKFYVVKTEIRANASEVWQELTNSNGLSMWDSGITKIEGDIKLGNKIKLYADMTGSRAFALKVTTLDINSAMSWEGGMPFGLFAGKRTFELTELNGVTKFLMREEFTGLLHKLIFKSMPDLQPSFDKFAMGLKGLIESKVNV